MRTAVLTVVFCLGMARDSNAIEDPAAGDDLFPAPTDLMDNVPADFPRFFVGGHDEAAQLLNRYCWHHYSQRPGVGKTLFNKEYLTLSDMWVTARAQRQERSIQDTHRDVLLTVQLDPEGYVHTHQHFSHAHDHGWPFPLWPQVPGGHSGVTMGWHFQEDGPDWMWLWPMLKHGGLTASYGQGALAGWELEGVRSEGIVDGKWRLVSTRPSPAIVTPDGVVIDAFNSPFLQLRWTRSGEPGNRSLPFIEWLREEDEAFGPDRRMYFGMESSEFESVTRASHSIIPMYRHPKWRGKIRRMRISLGPGEEGVEFGIDSFFTVYDTRHSINNPIFILASWNYFRWTGDLDFLRRNINRMRTALRYQRTEMGGLEYDHIRNPWWGHDGRPGFTVNPDGTKSFRPGHGIGNNYWDLLPFGGDDLYATAQYYAATVAMAKIEEAIREHPAWGVPVGSVAFSPGELRAHAGKVKEDANRLFWDEAKGRFAACIDADGVPHEYGLTFLNLDAIAYGLASEEHVRSVMDWITGRRIVEGDTSTGEDIYRWRFGPRATTLRNTDWYGQGWTGPEAIPWGGQIQDGGAVLGFSFYDLWARLHVIGADDAWRRLEEILAWEKEVWAEGGYREYYEGGKRGTTMQGGGTAGGIGIDCEFYESSLLPCIVVYGFLGLEPTATALAIEPKLPSSCPRMGISNLQYRGVRLDIMVEPDKISVAMKEHPSEPIRVRFREMSTLADTGETARDFTLPAGGVYRFTPGRAEQVQ